MGRAAGARRTTGLNPLSRRVEADDLRRICTTGSAGATAGALTAGSVVAVLSTLTASAAGAETTDAAIEEESDAASDVAESSRPTARAGATCAGIAVGAGGCFDGTAFGATLGMGRLARPGVGEPSTLITALVRGAGMDASALALVVGWGDRGGGSDWTFACNGFSS